MSKSTSVTETASPSPVFLSDTAQDTTYVLPRSFVVGAVCLSTAVVASVGIFIGFRMRKLSKFHQKSAASSSEDPEVPFNAEEEDDGSPADRMMPWEQPDEPSLWLAGKSSDVTDEWMTSQSPVHPGLDVVPSASRGHASAHVVSLSEVAESYMHSCRMSGTLLDGTLHDFTQAVRNSPIVASGRSSTPLFNFQTHTPQLGRSSGDTSPETASPILGVHSRSKTQAGDGAKRASRHKKVRSSLGKASSSSLYKSSPSPLGTAASTTPSPPPA